MDLRGISVFDLHRRQIWRRKHYSSPKKLVNKICEYFDWCEQNPLIDTQVSRTKDGLETINIPRKRMPTITGLIIHLGFTRKQWEMLEKDPVYANIHEFTESYILDDRKQCTVAGIYKHQLILKEMEQEFAKNINNKSEGSDGVKFEVSEESQKVIDELQKRKSKSKVDSEKYDEIQDDEEDLDD